MILSILTEFVLTLRHRTMMYNTGDLGRWKENGEIDILGRMDDQVKIKVSCLSRI